MQRELIKIERAIISVSDKTNIELLAAELQKQNIDLFASGNTAKFLKGHNIEVTEISDYTDSPEVMGGRVKTLHPRVHAGILARRDNPQDMRELEEIGAKPIHNHAHLTVIEDDFVVFPKIRVDAGPVDHPGTSALLHAESQKSFRRFCKAQQLLPGRLSDIDRHEFSSPGTGCTCCLLEHISICIYYLMAQ